MDQVLKVNLEKLEKLNQFNLPQGEYLITGSGPMGIRGLREIQDIDILVTESLWKKLSKRYGITKVGDIVKIVFPGDLVEAFCEKSFENMLLGSSVPSILERIECSEVIKGFPFDSLETTLFFKRLMSRKKDLQDILLVQQWQKRNS